MQGAQIQQLQYTAAKQRFKCLLKSGRVILLFCSATGREFQKCGAAAEKLLSPCHIFDCCTACMKHRPKKLPIVGSFTMTSRLK